MQAKTITMADFKAMYKHPFFVILITYQEVLPAVSAMAPVSALILRKGRNADL